MVVANNDKVHFVLLLNGAVLDFDLTLAKGR